MTTYKDIDYILEHLPDDVSYKGAIKRVLLQAPAADVRPIVKGTWIEEPDRWLHWHCSECGYAISGLNMEYHYCPNCGAETKGKMPEGFWRLLKNYD